MTPRTQPLPSSPDHDDDVTSTRSLPPSIPPRRATGAHPQARTARVPSVPPSDVPAHGTARPTAARPPLPAPTARIDGSVARPVHTPDAHAADGVAERIEDRAPKPSVVQVVASALAAISSTLLLSYLGVAGTIVGAGIASVLTVLGNFVYQRSMLRAHQKVATALRTGARLGAGASASEVTAVGAARERSADQALGASGNGDGTAGPSAASGPEDPEAKRRVRRRLVVAAVALFAAIVAVVTVVELVAGKPLSNLLHGTEGSGTSISDITRQGSGGGSVPAPSPTSTETGGTTGDGSTDGTTSDPEPTTTPGSTTDPTTGGDPTGSGSTGSGTGDGTTGGSSGSSGSDSSGSTGTGSQDGTSTGDQGSEGSTGSGGTSGGAGATEPTTPSDTQPTTSSDAVQGFAPTGSAAGASGSDAAGS